MPNSDHPYLRLKKICDQHQAKLVVVSKKRSVQEVMALYNMGQRIFAENRAKELIEKVPQLPGDISWHLIGHLQSNKVKWVLPLVDCIQSLDSEKLWHKIQAEAEALDRNMNCLLQLKIAREDSKYGWTPEDLYAVIRNGIISTCPNVTICGVMGMATFTSDMNIVRREMRQLKTYFHELQTTFFQSHPEFNTISMGMSGDYPVALEEGSTMVRIGSLLFPDHPVP